MESRRIEICLLRLIWTKESQIQASLPVYGGNYNYMENACVGFASIGVGVAIGIGIDAWE